MTSEENRKTKKAAQILGEKLRTFGVSVGEILDDPAVKEKAKELAESIVDAAARVVQNKVEDKEVRARFRGVGEAAETLGKSLEEHFKT